MDEEIRKHFRAVRILVTLALLAAFLSFAFTYVLFKEVSAPLERLRTQEYAKLEEKLESFISSRAAFMSDRMAIELQLAVHDLDQIVGQTSGDLQAQAQKALAETRSLLELLQRPAEEPLPQDEPQVEGAQ